MKIEIEDNEDKGWTVRVGDKWADRLCYEEMLGLFAVITSPKNSPMLFWLKTAEQHKKEGEYFENLKEKSNV